ncbi:ParA family protein [Enemella dayhoffiae]|uniref:ParA family protein n=1 Tax=Enemella dayhoffiae TaxID=2016507 RepID=UPI001595E398|nr:ParA family protein [Enemella dayhoffiae]
MTTPTILTICTAAGSSGKSTIADALAALEAERGQRVLFIDADPQSDGTLVLGVEPHPDQPGIGHVLTGRATLAEATVDTASGVQLVPANPAMSETLAEFSQRRGADMRLRQVLTDTAPEVDLIVIDCPGDATARITIAAVCAADHVISTTFAAGKESKGLVEVEDLVTEFAGLYGLAVRFSAVVPCAVQPPSRNNSAQSHLANIREAFGELVTPTVRWSELVLNAYDARQPVPVFAPSAAVTRDLRAVRDDLIAKGVL